MKLEEQYELLMRHQRLVLYLKAVGREDRHEMRRIIAASIQNQKNCVDFTLELTALHVTNLMYCALQLDVLATFNALWPYRQDKLTILWCCVFAKYYAVAEEAWQSICEEYGLDWQKMMTNMHGAFMNLGNELTGKFLRIWALTDEDYKAFSDMFAGTEMPLPTMPTVAETKRQYESAVASYKTMLEGVAS